MINQAISLVTDQVVLPVSISDIKLHIPGLLDRNDRTSDEEDQYVEGLIRAATSKVEEYTGRKMLTCTYDLKLTEFPVNQIVLPYAPVQSITSVKYYIGGVETTWGTGNYWYSTAEEPLTIRYESSPGVDDDYWSVTVRFVAGYTQPNLVPAQLRQAIMMLVGDMYESRADAVRERFTLWHGLAMPYRVFYDIRANQE